jgi:hypothetical protein
VVVLIKDAFEELERGFQMMKRDYYDWRISTVRKGGTDLWD